MRMEVGDVIPSGIVHFVDGSESLLTDIVNPNGITILNFGSCS